MERFLASKWAIAPATRSVVATSSFEERPLVLQLPFGVSHGAVWSQRKKNDVKRCLFVFRLRVLKA